MDVVGRGGAGFVGDAVARASAVRRALRPAALRQRALLPVRAASRRAWTRRGRDITRGMTRASCLVVAPHPDDETLGCGVAIMRKREAGTQVTVVIVTDGAAAEPASLPPAELAALRREEARRAASRLGLRPVDLRFLDVPDTHVAQHVDEVADLLAELLTGLAPDQLLIPASCEGHPDHDATNVAALEAARRAGFAGETLEYCVWLWTHWPWTRGYGSADYRSAGSGPASEGPAGEGPVSEGPAGYGSAGDRAGGDRARRPLRDPLDRIREVRPLLVGAKGYRSRQAYALAAHGSQVGLAAGGATLPPAILAATKSRFEVYLEAGALAHLNFGAPGTPAGPAVLAEPGEPPPPPVSHFPRDRAS
jgi:LmbE family N-acetylglucosaminyl deacetylase